MLIDLLLRSLEGLALVVLVSATLAAAFVVGGMSQQIISGILLLLGILIGYQR